MESILKEFDGKQKTLESFSKTLKSLIGSLLFSEGIVVHSISCRVKDKNSLSNKIIKKQRYESLSEITDIVGVRIITHYSDEVDKVAEIIVKEFAIDEDNSIDKRKTLEPDRFGYLSLHYVVSLNDDRCKLKEYASFQNLKAEIQVRSILQHTWAEIEHDIGYKSSKEVPDHIRRQFSQLAGLLEIADTQFISIKESLQNYKEESAIKIEDVADKVTIDRITLSEYFKRSKVVGEISEIISKSAGLYIANDDVEIGFDDAIDGLFYFKVDTIGKLDTELKTLKNLVAKRIVDLFGKFLKEDGRGAAIPPMLLVNMLSQIMAARNGSFDEVMEYLNNTRSSMKDALRINLAKKLVAEYSYVNSK